MLGPIDGHCTHEQLAQAGEWWAAALPAWPRWIATLSAAGVPSLRALLLSAAKGTPTALIPKHKGHGTVPHFRGRAQNEALERDGMVATEVYACVFALYSAAALDAQ